MVDVGEMLKPEAQVPSEPGKSGAATVPFILNGVKEFERTVPLTKFPSMRPRVVPPLNPAKPLPRSEGLAPLTTGEFGSDPIRTLPKLMSLVAGFVVHGGFAQPVI